MTQSQSAWVRCHTTPAWKTPALLQSRWAAPNPVEGLVGERLDVVGAAHVGADPEGVGPEVPDLGDGVLQGRRLDVGQDDAHAFARGVTGETPADAAGGSGHDGDAAGEVVHHRSDRKQAADVFDEELRLLHRREVPPAGHVRVVHQVVVAFRPPFRGLHDLLRVSRVPRRDLDAGSEVELSRPQRVVELVVQPQRRVRGVGDPVQHDVVEKLVFAEAALDVAVAVGPGPELLHDPGAQPGG